MEHILTDCPIPGRTIIWNLAQNLWLKKHDTWPEIRNIGSILKCGLADFKTHEGKPDPGANRLYRIIISESAFLIWKLRCNRVMVAGTDEALWPSEDTIKKKWYSAIERRLTLDRAMTHKKFEKRALKLSVVRNTWRGILQNESDMPDDWLKSPTEGLVSIDFAEQNLRQRGPYDPP